MYNMKSKELNYPFIVQPNSEEELWEKMRFMNPNIKLEDFETELELWGLQDLTITTNIRLKWILGLMKKYGGDGLSHLRLCWKQNHTGELDKRVQEHKNLMIRTKSLFNQYILNR